MRITFHSNSSFLFVFSSLVHSIPVGVSQIPFKEAEAYHVSGESPKEFLNRQKPCPSVVPMLLRDHVFRRVAVACDSFRKVLSHLFLRRTCLTARCLGISAPLRITLVREFNCADTVMHERYPRKRKTHRKTDAQSSLYIPRHRNTEMFQVIKNFFENIFFQ